jgi:hypothetical protein
MIIQAISQYQQLEKTYKASKMRPKAGNAVFSVPKPKDAFEPASKKNDIRQDLISTVRKKIRLGYYNSQTVLEDLSDSFAKAMNQA